MQLRLAFLYDATLLLCYLKPKVLRLLIPIMRWIALFFLVEESLLITIKRPRPQPNNPRIDKSHKKPLAPHISHRLKVWERKLASEGTTQQSGLKILTTTGLQRTYDPVQNRVAHSRTVIALNTKSKCPTHKMIEREYTLLSSEYLIRQRTLETHFDTNDENHLRRSNLICGLASS